MHDTFHCGRYRLNLDPRRGRPLVMGILNVTPDSFSDGGRFSDLESALNHAEQMIADGVDIIDIGGESTRPGAPTLSVEEELRRVLPVVFALRDCGKPLSVDTCKTEVMREVLAAGADMINDINGLRAPGALRLIKESDAALCIMHMQNQPGTMQNDPQYHDVVAEVSAFLQERVDQIVGQGIGKERLCIDPGFGFGKTVQHNLALWRRLDDIQRTLDLPLLAGLSRKSTLGTITGRGVDQRMVASVAAAVVAVERGARLVRVHDVAETVDALKVWHAVAVPAPDSARQP